MVDIIRLLFIIIGYFLLLFGAIINVLGAIGVLRFPNYFTRLHAATVMIVGGSIVPIMGLVIMNLSYPVINVHRIAIALGSLATGIFILITAPVATHIIARAAYRYGVNVKPILFNKLEEDLTS